MMIDDLAGNVKKFAEACYDMNSIDELEQSLTLQDADKTDCEEWSINSEEWLLAIKAALNEKKLNAC